MKINFAVIGTNSITDAFLKASNTVEDFQLKGVYSRSMERAAEYEKKHNAELIVDNLDELAACREIDAVSDAMFSILLDYEKEDYLRKTRPSMSQMPMEAPMPIR